MKLISFDEQNITFAKDQPEYFQLPAHRFKNDDQGHIACCWQLTLKERIQVLFHGLVWHEILTFNSPLQPQKLSTQKPAMDVGEI